VRVVLVGLVAAVAAAACHPQPRRIAAPVEDAPYRLDDDDDRAVIRGRFAELAADAPERAGLRAELATAVGARIGEELARDRLRRAQRYVLELLGLWRDDPAAFGAEAAPLVPVLIRARDRFARAGDDDGALAALIALVEADPAHRAAWRAEVDEVLAYTDDLARATGGETAIRSRAIPALTPIVQALPVRWLVDAYVDLVAARQTAVNDVVVASGATIELVQAHADVLEASHQIAGALARGGRLEELVDRVGRLTGLGADRKLALAAAAIAGAPRRPEPWASLAARLRAGRKDDTSADDDPGAAYAVCTAGLAVLPRNPTLLACAAEHAAGDGRPRLAARLFEQLFADGAEDAIAAGRLGGLYRDRIGELGYAGRLRAARAEAKRLDRFLADLAGRVPTSLLRELRRDGDVVLARALISQGAVDEARAILVGVAAHAPTVDALESLAMIEADRGRFTAARGWLERAIELGGDEVIDQLIRARLHRLAGEAAHREGKDDVALKHYVSTLSILAPLTGEDAPGRSLPDDVQGLRLIESARTLWAIGEADKAIDVFEVALAADADGEDTHVQVVAFLVLHARLREATDAFHRAASSEEIGDASKVYMALWLLGEARRTGAAPDRLALELLESRRGGAWVDALARAATGRITPGELAASARSPTERAELAFYTATLALGAPPPARVRALLEEVVRSNLILVFEREAARRRLKTAR
jgi:tetratricopeptide (TPR) repeat protein